ncbi:MAG: GHKL domain-containing protein [Cyclobacteriaceae bacterium]|nr:GHKL domain-containing protein [Cyclobacteriaceae bacterium]
MRITFFLIYAFLQQQAAATALDHKIGLDPGKPLSTLTMDQWTGKDGLISNNLTSVAQHSNKFIWITTFNGIIRFDGVNFKLFDKNNLPYISSNGFYKSFEDSKGNVWFTSQSSGIIRLTGHKFYQVLSEEGSAHSVRCIEEDRQGNIWVGTNNEGIFLLEDSALVKIDIGELEKYPIMDIEVDLDGKIWFATNGAGIFTYQNHVIEQLGKADNLNNLFVNQLLLAPDGTIYAGTFDGIYRMGENDITHLSPFDGLEINEMVFDDYNCLWAATEQGLFRLNLDSKLFQKYTEEEGLPANQVSGLAFDHENSLWLSTKKSGLLRIRSGFFKNITTTDGLSSNNVNIVVEHNDKFYVGSDDGSIFVVEGKSVLPFPLKNSSLNVGIRDINFGSGGDILVASYRGLTSIKNGVENAIDLNRFGAGNDIRRILRSSNGTIWLATRSSGVVKYDEAGKTIVYDSSKGLQSNYILAVEENQAGDLYIGTHSGGLSILKKSGEIVNYPIENGRAGILIFNIHVLNDESLWIATNIGIYKFVNGGFFKITLDDQLNAETIFDIVLTEQYAWLSSNVGLIRVALSDLEKFLVGSIKMVPGNIYDRYDGMASQECTGATRMTLGSNGKLWIPTLGGVALLDPENIHRNLNIPQVYITEFKADFKDQPITSDKAVVIEPGAMRYEFQFASLSFIAPPKVQFKYMLKGIDSDWIIAGSEREALYTNLPYGQYEFQVIASNNDGLWNNYGASLKFKIEPYFYETTVFYVMVIALVGLGIWGVFIWRVHNIEKVNSELRKLNEELDRFVYSASHDLRAPLSSVLGLVEIARLEQTVQAKDECLGMINVSIKKLDGFINDIIDYSRNQRIELQSDNVDIEKEVKDVFDDLKYLDKDNRIAKSVTIDEMRHFITDGRRLSVILKNLVSNAIRYHDYTKQNLFIKVNITFRSNFAVISVSDNGIGIEDRHLDNIFKMFYRANESSKGSGLGLYIVKETVDKLHGNITVKSVKDAGTTFTLTIPSLKPKT